MFKGSRGNINSFARVVVIKNASLIECCGVIDRNDIEDLIQGIRVKSFVPQNTLQSNRLFTLARSFKPKSISDLFHQVHLIRILFTKTKSDFSSLLVPNQVGLAVDNFKLVIPVPNFLDHEKLPQVIGIRRNAYNACLVVLIRVVGLNSQGQVAVLAHNLIDISPWKLQSLHNILFKYESNLTVIELQLMTVKIRISSVQGRNTDFYQLHFKYRFLFETSVFTIYLCFSSNLRQRQLNSKHMLDFNI